MSLSERLAAAAEARARAEEFGTTVEAMQSFAAAGFALAESAPPPVERTILITGSDAVPTAEPDPTASPESICPRCGRTGEMGVVDLPGRTSDYSCPACHTMWRVNLASAAPTR